MKLRSLTASIAATAIVALLVSMSGAASARTLAHVAGATTCNISSVYNKLGPTYVEKLTVSGTSCSFGQNLIKLYNACRLKAGGPKGYCRSTIDGFRFTEKRSTGSPIQFIASVTATKGRTVVTFTYSENT